MVKMTFENKEPKLDLDINTSLLADWAHAIDETVLQAGGKEFKVIENASYDIDTDNMTGLIQHVDTKGYFWVNLISGVEGKLSSSDSKNLHIMFSKHGEFAIQERSISADFDSPEHIENDIRKALTQILSLNSRSV